MKITVDAVLMLSPERQVCPNGDLDNGAAATVLKERLMDHFLEIIREQVGFIRDGSEFAA
jgi:hypothetical protein